jgi:hypothetical protein
MKFESSLENHRFARRVCDHVTALYRDKRSPKFCAQRAMHGQI